MNSRTRRLSLSLLAAGLLAACAHAPEPVAAPTAASGVSANLLPSLPTSSPSSLPVSDAPIFLGPGLVNLAREHKDRYQCLSGAPLACTCQSRLSFECACRC